MQPMMQIARGVTVFMARNLTTNPAEIKRDRGVGATVPMLSRW
jgi:hypothetical protein